MEEDTNKDEPEPEPVEIQPSKSQEVNEEDVHGEEEISNKLSDTQNAHNPDEPNNPDEPEPEPVDIQPSKSQEVNGENVDGKEELNRKPSGTRKAHKLQKTKSGEKSDKDDYKHHKKKQHKSPLSPRSPNSPRTDKESAQLPLSREKSPGPSDRTSRENVSISRRESSEKLSKRRTSSKELRSANSGEKVNMSGSFEKVKGVNSGKVSEENADGREENSSKKKKQKKGEQNSKAEKDEEAKKENDRTSGSTMSSQSSSVKDSEHPVSDVQQVIPRPNDAEEILRVSNEAFTIVTPESASSKEDIDDDNVLPENIVWEWEQELEEYDEPDIYPSEKDYAWVPTQVEMTSEDEAEEEAARVAAVLLQEQNDAAAKAAEIAKKALEEDRKKSEAKSEKMEQEDVTEIIPGVSAKDSEKAIHQEKVNLKTDQIGKDDVVGADETSIEANEIDKGGPEKIDSKEDKPEENRFEEEKQMSRSINIHKEGGSEAVQEKTDEGKAVDESDTKKLIKSDVETDKELPVTETKAEKQDTEDMVDDKNEENKESNINEYKDKQELKEASQDRKSDEGSDVKDHEEGGIKVDTDGESIESKSIDGLDNSRRRSDDERATLDGSEHHTKEDEENKEDEDDLKTIAEDEEEKASDEGKKNEEAKEKKGKDTVGVDAGQDGAESGDEADVADEFEVPGLAEADETTEPPPKKYKTILVKTLVPRPPKIHYVPEEERKTQVCSDKHHFRKRPMSLVMSYGYDCQRMANLHVLDKETIVYMAGFVLTFYNHVTGEQSYLRCIGGSCFGALAIHPSRKLFAAAEKGDNPIIGIWSWPKQQLFRKLRDGANKSFASCNFSPCGRFLATQGGEPDYLITVYNWLAEKPVVRVRSHAQDVYRVTFSKELSGRLTTSGLCHIKFWKMATTFTGLKLKGDLGRFGRTELSDIEGYIEMPDGKVLSGTEWGNLLLWENGLIVAEICLKHDFPCHEGIVRQIQITEGEFYTCGQDGYIRTWPFEAIDSAEINTTEESLKVPVKNSGQVLVAENADIWYIVPDIPDESYTSVLWFAQDGKGTIMCVDLCFLNTAREPYPILTAHGGPIVSSATSKCNCVFASLGADGQIRVYDYTTHELLALRTFSAPGTILIWPGVHLDPTGCTMVAGFADGTFRVLVLSGVNDEKEMLSNSIVLHQVRKPHSRKLTCIDIDCTGKYMATGGEDGTIFFFDIANDYAPLVFYSMPEYKSVISLKWIKYESKDASEEGTSSRILAGLEGATLLEMMMPKVNEIDNETTYLYDEPKFTRRVDFLSIKSELLHNEEVEKERIAEEQVNQATELENRKRIEEGLESESQQNLRLLAEAEEMERIKAEMGPAKKWEPYIPPKKSAISLMIPSCIDNDEMFLSMDDYDNGYLYMMRFGDAEKCSRVEWENPREPDNATKFEDARDKTVTAYAMTTEGDYVFWGFSDGRVRIQTLEYPYAFEHMNKHWTEGFHDCIRGKITSLSIDKDGILLITTGDDGNCFLFSRLSEKELDIFLAKEELQYIPAVVEREEINDIKDAEFYTLEVYKNVEKELALLLEAKKNKAAKREEIAHLRMWYNDVLKKNNELPEEVRLTPVELALTNDREIRKKEDYEAALKQLMFETAWNSEKARLSLNKVKNYYKDVVAYNLFELRAFTTTTNVWSFRISQLPDWFDEAKEKVETHVTPHSVYSDTFQEEVSPVTSGMIEKEPKPSRVPGMDKFTYQKLVRIWERKQRKVRRASVWKEFLKTEPKGKDLREEDKAIDEARANMGDMKLKSAADYHVPEAKKLTEHRARKRMVKLEETVNGYKSCFNELMLTLREDKIARLKKMFSYRDTIQECQKILPPEDIKPIPVIKEMVISENPNRTSSYTVEDVKAYKRQIEEKLKAAAPSTKSNKKQEGPPMKRKAPPSKSGAKDKRTIEKPPESKDVIEMQFDSMCSLNYLEPAVDVLSPLEEKIKRAEIIKSKYWQNHYIDKIQTEQLHFDAKLKLLRHRKLRLDCLLKISEERMVLLTQEFILAKESEALEASLEYKIHNTSKEKRDCTGVMKVVSKKLENVKKELDHFAKQKLALLHEVQAIAQSRAPAFEKYLVRVFNKRMHKTKSRQSLQQSSLSIDSEDEESSDSSDDDMDLDDDEEDGLDPDFPPPELNREIYDAVVEIRERRGKVDETETSTKEQFEELTSQMNAYKVRVNQSDREFEKARRELHVFRKEKQEKQNVLNCAVSMKLHQIEDLSRDFKNVLVVENRSIDKLMKRIPELHKEKIRQKGTGNEMKKLNQSLHQDKLQFQKRLALMSKRCDQEMVRKFGQIRPIEELEFFQTDSKVCTLKDEIKGIEDAQARNLRHLDHQIMAAEKDFSTETIKSTARLNTVAYVSERVHSMNKEMEEQMRKLPSELEDTLITREISFLKVILTDQWNTISALSLEIAHLSKRNNEPLPPIGKPFPRKK